MKFINKNKLIRFVISFFAVLEVQFSLLFVLMFCFIVFGVEFFGCLFLEWGYCDLIFLLIIIGSFVYRILVYGFCLVCRFVFCNKQVVKMCLFYMLDIVSFELGVFRVNYLVSFTQLVLGFFFMMEVILDFRAL